MESITLAQAAAALAFIVAIIGGITSLKKSIKSGIESALKDKFDDLEKSNKEILKRLDNVEMENCKNFLVTFLAEVARGEIKDETEMQRFWEEYSHYEKLGGNSYIKNKVSELKAKNRL